MRAVEDWLIVPAPNPGAMVRLLCIPSAGAGMLMYRGWSAALPWAEVVLAHLPGRDGRRDEPMPASIQDIAAQMDRALRAQDRLPRLLFGHSMGALIAFETAMALERGGSGAAGLFVSGRRAPSCPEPLEPISRLPLPEFGAAAQARYGGIPDAVLVDVELANIVLPVLQADLALVESYRRSAGGPLKCPVFVYAGQHDPHTTEAELVSWTSETTGRTVRRSFPGGHFYLDAGRDFVLRTLAADVAGLSLTRDSPP